MPRRTKKDGPTLPIFAEEAGDEIRLTRSIGSAVWAAYGDALGFISELTDANGLLRRTNGQPLVRPIEWKRMIGGRQGVNAVLPVGCYSDDTQLRLSSGRAIGRSGFDVEAFAKVELTVWPSYALGGGRGTKTAASNLAKDQVAWYANNFKGWTVSGGNGAAMRIQPHVWASRDLADPTSYLLDVVRNAICTHSSPVGILGAVLHALAVAQAIEHGSIPTPKEFLAHLQASESIPSLVRDDAEMGEFWVRLWEREVGRTFEEAWASTVEEARSAVETVSNADLEYTAMLDSLQLFNPKVRGSGLLTSIAAVALLWRVPDVEDALKVAANAAGSDTDTIATMAGAIGGAVAPALPATNIQDLNLIRDETTRLVESAMGNERPGHTYPDLLHWSAPRSQADALLQGPDSLVVAGLGAAKAIEGEPLRSPGGDFLWQWVGLEFGQSLLIKRRPSLEAVPPFRNEVRKAGKTRATQTRMEDSSVTVLEGPRSVHTSVETPTVEALPVSREGSEQPTPPIDRGVDLEVVLAWLNEDRLQSDESVGYVLRRVARDGTPEQLLLLVGSLRERLRQ